VRRSIVFLALAITFGCSSRSETGAVIPANPESAVTQFLDAVGANSLGAMAELWGTSRGPAADRMDPEELRKRLAIIQVYLTHERYEIVPDTDPVRRGTGNERRVQVRVFRQGCEPVVPFTLVRWRDGWLVSNIDLTVMPNPARACSPGG